MNERVSRRRGWASLGLGLLLAVGALASAEAQDVSAADPETVRAVTAVKKGILAGHKARDRAALDRLYADSYTATDAKGEVTTKKELLDGLASGAEIVEGAYDLIKVRRWGNVAVANGHGRIVYRNPDGSTRVSEYDSVNVFELVNGRWYYVAAFLP